MLLLSLPGSTTLPKYQEAMGCVRVSGGMGAVAARDRNGSAVSARGSGARVGRIIIQCCELFIDWDAVSAAVAAPGGRTS